LEEWARILREKNKKTEKILHFLSEKGIADIHGLDNQSDNQNITIRSRRMVRDLKLSQLRREVGKLGGNPNLKKQALDLVKQNDNQNSTLPFPSPLPSPFPNKDKEKTSKKKQPKKRGELVTHELAETIIGFYNRTFETNWYQGEDQKINIHARLNKFAERYKQSGRDMESFITDARGLIKMVKETWPEHLPKGIDNIFRYGRREGEDQFLKRMENLDRWRSGESKRPDIGPLELE